MKHRVIAVGIIRNKKGQVLLCKKPDGLGIFPGQWSLPGGGIDEGERMEEGLRREVREEVGLEVEEIKPFEFRDDVQVKYYEDGSEEEIYMIYLLFDCRANSEQVVLNKEFEAHEWVEPKDLKNYDLNEATRETFAKKGWL